uniref:Integrase zinc-binding domain-containing protein n=1 Tax=Amphimedon queenslandica TaxID=400682 RepID=A0A1X7T7V5_AMPQE
MLPNFDFQALAAAQHSDKELEAFSRILTLTLILRPVPLPYSDTLVVCDMSTGTACPFVLSTFREQVFARLHALSHPGIRASQCLVTSRFVLPGINSDVRKWARQCIQCQRFKVHRHNVTPLSQFPTTRHRFTNIHIDLVGPLPPSGGFTYLLTMIDKMV